MKRSSISNNLRTAGLTLALLAGLAAPAAAANITTKDWGTTAKGETVQLFTLKGARGLEAHITNFGGVIVDLLVPAKGGRKVDVMLGYDDFASYEKGGVFGALIGRVVGRVSNGGTFPLDGKTIQLEKTNPAAKFVIHGGTAGFQKKLWHAEMEDGPEPKLILTLASSDGAGGFPGLLVTTVTYTVTRNNSLKLDYSAVATAPTIVNLTNHAYFAIQGEGNGDVSGQTLQVFADKYMEQDADILITGATPSVDGTPLDFRKPVRIGEVLNAPFPQIAMRGGGLDIGMIINGKPGTLRPAARLSDPNTGIVMDIATTQPTMQLYSYGIGTRTNIGKGGKTYRSFYSMSLETQGYLDASNHPNFPSNELRPGQLLHEVTTFRFGLAR
jgi:aldose 1-epimerase